MSGLFFNSFFHFSTIRYCCKSQLVTQSRILVSSLSMPKIRTRCLRLSFVSTAPSTFVNPSRSMTLSYLPAKFSSPDWGPGSMQQMPGSQAWFVANRSSTIECQFIYASDLTRSHVQNRSQCATCGVMSNNLTTVVCRNCIEFYSKPASGYLVMSWIILKLDH